MRKTGTVSICKVCHRTDAHGPIKHDPGFHKNFGKRTMVVKRLARRCDRRTGLVAGDELYFRVRIKRKYLLRFKDGMN